MRKGQLQVAWEGHHCRRWFSPSIGGSSLLPVTIPPLSVVAPHPWWFPRATDYPSLSSGAPPCRWWFLLAKGDSPSSLVSSFGSGGPPSCGMAGPVVVVDASRVLSSLSRSPPPSRLGLHTVIGLPHFPALPALAFAPFRLLLSMPLPPPSYVETMLKDNKEIHTSGVPPFHLFVVSARLARYRSLSACRGVGPLHLSSLLLVLSNYARMWYIFTVQ
jgi:hypothetical protein